MLSVRGVCQCVFSFSDLQIGDILKATDYSQNKYSNKRHWHPRQQIIRRQLIDASVIAFISKFPFSCTHPLFFLSFLYMHAYTLTSNGRLGTSLSSLDLQVLFSSNTSLYQSARFDSALPQCISAERGISGQKKDECVNVWHRTRSVIHPDCFSALVLSQKVSIATLSSPQYIFNPLISIITYGCGVYGLLLYMCGWNRYPLCVCVQISKL